ncbi:nuclear pore complex protein NUP98A [Euphorbia lathyris]|uniref:nuclear pore complex protein NUP98A n=1 Tax=Euphorbia lathyris TaxID=212925 RepID=UPI003313AA9F
MFGSTAAFGQSSSSPFGSQPIFGQTNNANNNPFAPKPFGSTTPFGAQTGGSIFGGTSTGMFGAPQTSSPFSSTTTFGASSSPAFGSSAPTFGATSASAFGGSSTSFGGSSVFGQKPAFGGFGSNTQTSPFGSTSQPSQPAFGSGLFGSTTPFGASSQSAFGAASSPGFGASSTPPFGSSSTPAFGASGTSGFGASGTPSFGATSTPTFGATASPAFGTGAAFGASNNPAFGSGGGFGASSAPVFGSSSTSGFGATGSAFGASTTSGFGGTSSTPVFGGSSAPAFGSTSAFGTSSTPSFNFGSSPSFGQSTSAFGNTQFGTSASPFSAQTSPFGAQATTPTFGSSGFGQTGFAGNRGGSRVVAYSATAETDSSGGQPAKLESISAMSVYKDKSHEELRWEDYQLGDKGGPVPLGQSSNFAVSSGPTNLFAQPSTAVQSSAVQFSSTISSNPFITKPNSQSPFPIQSSPFQSTSGFGQTSSPAFTQNAAPSSFVSTPSLFTSTVGQSNSSQFANFSNTQPSLSFSSSLSPYTQTGSGFGQSTSLFAPSTTASFNQTNMFNTPTGGFGFSNTQSMMPSNNQGLFNQTAVPQSSNFQLSQPSQPAGGLSFSNFGQSQPAGTSGFTSSTSLFGPNPYAQLSTAQGNVAVQPVPVTNPFGTLPAMPQMSIGRAGATPSVQYGISNLPVVDKPPPVRISSLLTSRHLSQRRIKLPARKYNPKHDGPRVPFFSDEEETTGAPKADALFVPRENPRALVIRPTEQWSLRPSSEKASASKDVSTAVNENGKTSEAADVPSSSGSGAGGKDKNVSENGHGKERVHLKQNQKPNGVQDDNSTQEELYRTLSGHRAGEAAIVYEHGADIEALMPKLRRSDYYTEPRIQELAAKERAEPGFCRHVKDFVVGRHGYGSIKFMGETDVRRLDLESLVQFNNREVIVYTDDSKKPPIGQGLNKPAEVTLLNIKCFEKKTGRQFTEGPKIERYKEMLKRKAEDQGAEFVSYDPVKGEWKFKVNHFSKYMLGDEDEWEDADDWVVVNSTCDC